MIKTYEDWENSLDQNYVRQLSPDAWDLTGSAFEAGQQSQQAKIDELQARIDVYELHTKTLKNIHDNDFKEHSKSSYILGNLDGFFECLESDLKGNKDENY